MPDGTAIPGASDCAALPRIFFAIVFAPDSIAASVVPPRRIKRILRHVPRRGRDGFLVGNVRKDRQTAVGVAIENVKTGRPDVAEHRFGHSATPIAAMLAFGK